jgi:hypothetical protein
MANGTVTGCASRLARRPSIARVPSMERAQGVESSWATVGLPDTGAVPWVGVRQRDGGVDLPEHLADTTMEAHSLSPAAVVGDVPTATKIRLHLAQNDGHTLSELEEARLPGSHSRFGVKLPVSGLSCQLCDCV